MQAAEGEEAVRSREGPEDLGGRRQGGRRGWMEWCGGQMRFMPLHRFELARRMELDSVVF